MERFELEQRSWRRRSNCRRSLGQSMGREQHGKCFSLQRIDLGLEARQRKRCRGWCKWCCLVHRNGSEHLPVGWEQLENAKWGSFTNFSYPGWKRMGSQWRRRSVPLAECDLGS